MSAWGKDEASVHVLRHKFLTLVHVSETHCFVPHELQMTRTAVGAKRFYADQEY